MYNKQTPFAIVNNGSEYLLVSEGHNLGKFKHVAAAKRFIVEQFGVETKWTENSAGHLTTHI